MSDAGEMDLGLESVKGFAGNFTQAVIGFAGALVFARILGPTAFGGFYFLLALVFIADKPVRGFAVAVKKRYSEIDASRSEIAGSVWMANLALFLALAPLVYLLRNQLIARTNVDGAHVVFMALLVALCLFISFQQMLGASGQVARQIWIDTLRSGLTFPLQLLFVLGGFGAAGMGYGLAGATLLVIPPILLLVPSRPALPSRRTVGSLWEYARYSVPNAFVTQVYSRLDTLLIGFVLSTGVVGYYKVAFMLTVPGTFVYSAIAMTLMPKVSNLYSKGETVTGDVVNSLSFAGIIAIPLFFGALAIPKALVVTFFGPEYAPASTLLIGLALYQVVSSHTNILQQTLSGLDRPRARLKVDAATMAFNVTVGLALVFVYGAVGVVVATVASESIRYGLTAFLVNESLDGVTLLPRSVGEQLFAGGLMFVFVDVLARYVPIRSWVELTFVVGLGAGFYGAVLLLVSGHHRSTARSIWGQLSA